MRKVRVTKYGTIHFYAQCTECEWDDAIHLHEKNRRQRVRNSVYRHVRETGHRVQLEAGTSTDYSLDSAT